jgi:hypothetical protein
MCLTVGEHKNQREMRPKSRSILKSRRSILSGSQPFFLTFTLHGGKNFFFKKMIESQFSDGPLLQF